MTNIAKTFIIVLKLLSILAMLIVWLFTTIAILMFSKIAGIIYTIIVWLSLLCFSVDFMEEIFRFFNGEDA